jgi:hypothetical protein
VEEEGKSRAKATTQKGKTVMPDVICVPNNNKAIHHLNMCSSTSQPFSVCSLIPSTNFRRYLIEKGFLLRCPFPCFHNILRVDDVSPKVRTEDDVVSELIIARIIIHSCRFKLDARTKANDLRAREYTAGALGEQIFFLFFMLFPSFLTLM